MNKIIGLLVASCIVGGCGGGATELEVTPATVAESTAAAAAEILGSSTTAPSDASSTTAPTVGYPTDAPTGGDQDPVDDGPCEVGTPAVTSSSLTVSDEWRIEGMHGFRAYEYEAEWTSATPAECGGSYMFVPVSMDGSFHPTTPPQNVESHVFKANTVAWYLGGFVFISEVPVGGDEDVQTGSFSIGYWSGEPTTPDGTYLLRFQVVDSFSGASSPVYEVPFHVGQEFIDPDGGSPRPQPATVTVDLPKEMVDAGEGDFGSWSASSGAISDTAAPCEVGVPWLVVDTDAEAPVMFVAEEWSDNDVISGLVVDYRVAWEEDNPQGCVAEYVMEPVSVAVPIGYVYPPSGGEMPGFTDRDRISWFLADFSVTSDVLVSGSDSSYARFTILLSREASGYLQPGVYTVAFRIIERRTDVASGVYEIAYHVGSEFEGPDGVVTTQPPEVEALCVQGFCDRSDQTGSDQATPDDAAASTPVPASGTSTYLASEEWNPGVFLPRHCTLESGMRSWVDGRGFDVVGSSGNGLWESISERATVSNADGVSCEPDWIMQLRMEAGLRRDSESSEEIYGSSYYVRVFPFFDEVPDSGQWGVWGQWIGDWGGAHPNHPFNSIEGGLFIADKMGRTRFPKYMIGSATHLYSGDSDATGGWGFYETRIDCGLLGRITLTNRVLVPPNLLGFEDGQDDFENEDGIFFGNSWVALPVFGGKLRSDDDAPSTDSGRLTWTFVADAANFSGPLVGYVPEHWARRLDRWNAMDILDDVYRWEPGSPVADALLAYVDGEITSADLHEAIAGEEWYGGDAGGKEYGSPHWVRPDRTLGFMPARGHISMGAEMAEVPVFIEMDDDGRLFAKIFPPYAPAVNSREPIVLNAQTYDVGLYNHFVDVFTGGVALSAFDTGFDPFGHPMTTDRWTPHHRIWTDDGSEGRLVDESDWSKIRASEHAASDLRLRIPANSFQVRGESNVYVDWGESEPGERGWGSYYEIIGAVEVMSAEGPWAEEFTDEALAEMRRLDIEIGSRLSISGLHPDDYQVVPVGVEEVPTSLRGLHYSTLRNPTTVLPHEIVAEDDEMISGGYTPDYSCYRECTLLGGCDPEVHEVVGDDGGRISYRWYRFVDQPAFRDLRIEYPEVYNDVTLGEAQATIEAMHAAWRPDQPFLERPRSVERLHLAEIDDALIVSPPPGREYGWVPIVLGVEFDDGVPQHGINFRGTPMGPRSR